MKRSLNSCIVLNQSLLHLTRRSDAVRIAIQVVKFVLGIEGVRMGDIVSDVWSGRSDAFLRACTRGNRYETRTTNLAEMS